MTQRVVKGATLEWGTDGIAYTAIPHVKSLAVPEVDIDYQESTSIDGDGSRTYVPGLRDFGEVTAPCGYDSAAFAQAITHQTAGTLIYFRATMPIEEGQATADTVEYQAYVRAQQEGNSAGEIMMYNLIMRVSGSVTYTEGTSA